MTILIFLSSGLYHFRDSDLPHQSPPHPQSPGVKAPSGASKAQITRQVIEAANLAGVVFDAVTGRVVDKHAARALGTRFKDTRKGRNTEARRRRKSQQDWQPGQSL